jgi:hypothetical protein
MSAPKVDGYFQLADRGLKTANILFREDQMEDAALNIQQVIERVAREACSLTLAYPSERAIT